MRPEPLLNTLSLDVQPSDAPLAREGSVEVVPLIDGRDLRDLVFRFERDSGFDDPAGGYGGILVGWGIRASSVPDYYLGRVESPLRGMGRIAVLGCSCGDLECWPLSAAVELGRSRVTWSHVRQPFRDRDYGGFGPFEFDRAAYEGAIEEAMEQLG